MDWTGRDYTKYWEPLTGLKQVTCHTNQETVKTKEKPVLGR
jgi:hypothetical protein